MGLSVFIPPLTHQQPKHGTENFLIGPFPLSIFAPLPSGRTRSGFDPSEASEPSPSVWIPDRVFGR